MTIKLDKYEQEIEDNFQGQKSVIYTTQLELLKSASIRHLKSKKSITK